MRRLVLMILVFWSVHMAYPALAQVAPTTREALAYTGLHEAGWSGDVARIKTLLGEGGDVRARDKQGRTPLHVAAFASHDEAVQALIDGGADVNALEDDRYDIVTIAAVANDVAMVKLALDLGGDAKAVTSPYDGTALIAAAHLGHHRVVRLLIKAGAPLDHVNNLQWTALLEAIILGDGGADHQKIVRMLIDAGADKGIADGEGRTPLDHARARNYREMINLLR